MKITAELVRVLQAWDPNTNTHTNSVIFGFAGVEVTVPVSEAQVTAIIKESARQRTTGEARPVMEMPRHPAQEAFGVEASSEVTGDSPLDDALESELTDEGGDTVFGGDYSEQPVAAPQLFQGEPPADPQPAPSLEEVLSGPKPPAPPPTPTQQRQAAVAAHRAQDPAAQRAATKEQMRARAAQTPMRRVAKDEVGNPVPTPVGAKIVGPAGRPEVVVRQQTPTVNTGGDDDGFQQG